MLVVGFSYMAFSILKYIPSFSTLLRVWCLFVFIISGCWILTNAILLLVTGSYDFYVSFCLYGVSHLLICGYWTNRVSWVDGDSGMASTCMAATWPPQASTCRLGGGGLNKETTASANTFVWQKAGPHLLPWCWTLEFLPVCLWFLSHCYSHAGAQRRWARVSPRVGPLRGTAWNLEQPSVSLSHHPCWVLQPGVMGTSPLGTVTLRWGGLVWS